MMRARPRTSSERGDDDGFGLPDLLVAMVLGSIVLTGVTAVFFSTIRSSRESTASVTSTAEVRSALDLMARRLRVAVLPPQPADPTVAPIAFVTTLPNDVVFYASLETRGTTTDPSQTKVEYVYDAAASCLRENLTTAAATTPLTWPASNTKSRCIARGVINGGGSLPMFGYYDTGTSTAPLPSTSSGVTAPGAIDSVSIQLSVTPPQASRRQPTTVTTRVTTVNLNIAGGL